MPDVTIYFSTTPEGKDRWRCDCSCGNWDARADTLEDAQRMGRLHASRRAHDRAEPRVVDHDPLFELLQRASMQDNSEAGPEPEHTMSVEAQTESAPALEGGDAIIETGLYTVVCSCGWRGSSGNFEWHQDAAVALEAEWEKHVLSVAQ